MTKRYFTLEESPYQPGKYTIRLDFTTIPSNISTTGSFNLLPARLLRLSYADYLRYCRDVYGAEVIGKNNYYPVAYFKNDTKTKQLVTMLNERMAFVAKHWRVEQ